MTNIKYIVRFVAPRGNFRRVLPLVAFAAATGLVGCVAYPYQGGQGYNESYYHAQPYYAAQPAYAGHWDGDPGWH
jgi:hypothetical protein